MGRLIRFLIPIVLVSAAMAGCIGADDGDDVLPVENGTNGGNGDGNETVDNGNVTVLPPPPVPVPQISVSAFVGEDALDEFVVFPTTVVDFELDGSASSVESGTLERYSWIVTRPNGEQVTGSGTEPTFNFQVNGTSTADYGVYSATLRALSDQNELGSTTLYWTLSYRNQFEFEHYMIGPSLGCDGELPQERASGALPLPAGPGLVRGTYNLHTVSTAQNISALNINLGFDTSDPQAEMKVYVFGPGPEPDGDCGSAIAESSASSGSISLDVEDLSEPGSYRVHVQLIGLFIEGYVLDVDALYSVPGEGPAEEEEEEEEDEE